MHFTRAIARTPGPDFADGLTEARLGSPDVALAIRQHKAYCRALKGLGLDLTTLDPLADHPDATFVEDVAVMLPDAAVITRPGADSRRTEAEAMESALLALPAETGISAIHRIKAPGILDGGDVMEVEDCLFIGISRRTNAEGARQLGELALARGREWRPVPVLTGLHLKTSVNYLGDNTLALAEHFAQRPEFQTFDKLVLPADQLAAANCLRIGEALVMASGYPEARQLFDTLGRRVIELDMSEFIKMDGGLSCLSLRF